MGNKQPVFSDEQLEEYQDCTYFNRGDILRIYKRYKDLNPKKVPKDYRNLDVDFRLKFKYLQGLPELKQNPFRRRICEVFSKNGDGSLSFDDFVNMLSALSESAPRQLKSHYAFKTYDFDGDHYIGRHDMTQVLKCISKGEMEPSEIEFVTDKLLEEADIDEDGKLSYMEFEKVVDRAPDFMNNFHIRI